MSERLTDAMKAAIRGETSIDLRDISHVTPMPPGWRVATLWPKNMSDRPSRLVVVASIVVLNTYTNGDQEFVIHTAGSGGALMRFSKYTRQRAKQASERDDDDGKVFILEPHERLEAPHLTDCDIIGVK